MSIRETAVYQVVCDCCGADTGDLLPERDTAEGLAVGEGWLIDDAGDWCLDCRPVP